MQSFRISYAHNLRLHTSASRSSCTELDAPFGRPDAIKSLAEGENGGQDSAEAPQQKEEAAAQSTAGFEPAPRLK